jgi:hypothetical protein
MRNAFQPFPTAVGVSSTDPRLSHAGTIPLITPEAEKGTRAAHGPAHSSKRICAATSLKCSMPYNKVHEREHTTASYATTLSTAQLDSVR